jgi:RHS repeat-associated protein
LTEFRRDCPEVTPKLLAPATLGQPFAVISTTAGYRATYDLNGNQTLRVSGGITYTQDWDPENRLAVVTNTVSGVVTRFTYDGDGNRVLHTVGTATTLYIGSQYEKDITSGTVTSYFYAGGQRIALRKGGTVSWLSGDHLGSTTLTANSAGTKIAEQLFSPFGTTRYSWGTTPTSYQFTGQRADATGLMFYVARYYDPVVGRWTQADAVVPASGNPQGLNRYAYVANNPLKYEDASGHCWGGRERNPRTAELWNHVQQRGYGAHNPSKPASVIRPEVFCLWLCVDSGILTLPIGPWPDRPGLQRDRTLCPGC